MARELPGQSGVEATPLCALSSLACAGSVVLVVLLFGLIVSRLRSREKRLSEAIEQVRRGMQDIPPLLQRVSERLGSLRERVADALAAAPPGEGRPRPRPTLLVVRRGENELFDLLTRRLRGQAAVEVVWDRRVGERRTRVAQAIHEARRADRRRPAPATWLTLGLALVPSGGEERPGLRSDDFERLQDLSRRLAEAIHVMRRIATRPVEDDELLRPR